VDRASFARPLHPAAAKGVRRGLQGRHNAERPYGILRMSLGFADLLCFFFYFSLKIA
jgi:hypothetical protein